MNRSSVRESLSRIERLAKEIEQNVSANNPRLSEFRSDLAGLLNVTTCAAYENCVKAAIQEYAGRQSRLFQIYTENQYEKISSRIDLKDLHRYAKTFHPQIGILFKERLSRIKQYYIDRTSQDITGCYTQLLFWRHSFAHTGARVTTVEEVIKHHKLAKRVIITFSDAFSSFPAS